jgi:hypothetical protein
MRMVSGLPLKYLQKTSILDMFDDHLRWEISISRSNQILKIFSNPTAPPLEAL